MNNIISIFLPDSSLAFLACISYLLIFVTSYNRFNAPAENYGPYDAPENARPWTTLLRYHAAAAIYACLFLLLFAVVYNLISLYPNLLAAIAELFGIGELLDELKNILSDDIELLGPVFTLIVLTWGIERYSKAVKIDVKIRHFFQRLGSIPGAVSGTIKMIKSCELEIHLEDCTAKLSEYRKHAILNSDGQNKPKSLENIYLRVCYLYQQIKIWNNLDSPFFHFKTAYPRTFENIINRFEKIDERVERYYQLKTKYEDVNKLCDASDDVTLKKRYSDMHRKVVTELCRDLREDLKHLLNNIYIYIACAIHSEGRGKKSRQKLLESMGFRIGSDDDTRQPGINFNDLTILTVFLLTVIPVSAALSRLVADDKVALQMPITYVVWSIMALYVGLVSVVTPQLIRQAQQKATGFVWKYIRPPEGRRPWCSFLIGGAISGLTSIVGLCLLSYLEPQNAGRTLADITYETAPWGLVPFAVTFTLGYHLDRETQNGRVVRVLEAVTTAFFAVLAAVLALYISSGTVDEKEFESMVYFSIPAAALLGCLIGAIFPARYRRHKDAVSPDEPSAVNLKSTIQDCLNDLADREGQVKFSVQSDVDPDLSHLMLNQTHMKQAIHGMLCNAMQFSPENSAIDIAAKKTDSGGVRLSVRDRGIGMDPEKVKTIVDVPDDQSREAFEDLYHQDDANLIQIKSIAESHGGRFDLQSSRWEGTEVTIELPEKILLPGGIEGSSAESEIPVSV